MEQIAYLSSNRNRECLSNIFIGVDFRNHYLWHMANKDLVINNPDLTVEQKVLGLIMCIAQETNGAMNNSIKHLGVSVLQVNILHILSYAPEGKLTVNQIKKFLIDESPNVSRALNKLMTAGYIVKNRSEKDQRVVHIEITEEGRNMHIEADKCLIPSVDFKLEKTDAEKLFEILKKM
jgi:DNA-binding MarR family transcriptional regulator